MKKQALKILFLSILTGLLWGCTSPGTPPEQVVLRGTTMGTFYTIKVVMAAADEGEKQRVHQGVKEILIRVNEQMSIFDPQSEVSRFNRHQQLDWFAVSNSTAWVLSRARLVSEKSKGAFDVTVAPLINAWGFGTRRGVDQVPSAERISVLKNRVGYQKLHARLEPAALKKDVAALGVNLSAIAKGYGVDRVAEFLTNAGYSRFLVEIGGEIAARGTNQQASPWRIGVASPQNQLGIQTIVPLKDLAMATSGDYRNYYKAQGKRYSHTIDPRVGKPIEHDLASVTVVHPSCTMADAWATALHVLGPDEGYAVAERENLRVFFIIRSANEFVERKTSAFKKLILKKDN